MAIETPSTSEPRALAAALAAPVFTPRMHGAAMHTASRHVERWAPETDAGRVRSMRSLGFVDRLVAPWIETAQRSAGLRMFSQYLGANGGFAEREGSAVSWVFPRPWYQDELDWMAAARHVTRPNMFGGGDDLRTAQPAMLTTRGTYVPPARTASVPAALYEYVAPSLSVARGPMPPIAFAGGVDHVGGPTSMAAPRMTRDIYSPLVPLAAVQAAQLVQRTMAQLTAPTIAPAFSTPSTRVNAPQTMAPALRSVLATMLSRAALQTPSEPMSSRWAASVPEMSTPPAPRAPQREVADAAASAAPSLASEDFAGASPFVAAQASPSVPSAQNVQTAQNVQNVQTAQLALSAQLAQTAQSQAAERMATQLAEQRTRVVELQRAAQQAIAREVAARVEQRGAAAPSGDVAQQRAQLEVIHQQRAQVEAAQQRAIAQRAAETAQAAQSAQSAQADETTRAAYTEAQRAQLEAARIEQQQAQVRIDERVAQRIAERTSERVTAQRLHEQARTTAASDARVAPVAVADVRSERASNAPRATMSEAAVAAIAAAMSGPLAALAPELAAIVGARPERAAQAIGELSEALRAAELMSHATASGRAFETTRGPRLMMPAGLGGLVATVDHAHAIERSAGTVVVAAPIGMTGMARREVGIASASPRMRDDLRVPTLSWVTAGGGANANIATGAPTSALGATAAASPSALQHVAWADRWLARFAGATPASLAALDGASTMSPMLGIANAAPGAVFVAPTFDSPAGGAARAAAMGANAFEMFAASTAAAPAAAAPAATSQFSSLQLSSLPSSSSSLPSQSSSPASSASASLSAAAPTLMRFDDTQETPDDVFAAISASASRARGAQAAQAAASRGVALPEPTLSVPTAPGPSDRGSYADAIAHAVPAAPNAGLAAQLASSPFAPALRHMLPMPSAATFDVRALFGGALSATYLAGILGASAREIASVPSGVPWSPLSGDVASIGASGSMTAMTALGAMPGAATREAPEWDATYVAPELPAGVAPGLDASGTAIADGEAPAMSQLVASRVVQSQPQFVQQMPALTTLRSALLAWDVELPAMQVAAQMPTQLASQAPGSFATTAASSAAASPTSSAGTARSMIDAMTMPMLGDSPTAPGASAMWSAPGMVADRAQSWSVAQERSAADMSFDFVTPELVLAARVYGLGPAEAAQAARLAIAGPGQLTAMAGMVNRTFVQAMAADTQRREAMRAISAYPESESAAPSMATTPASRVMSPSQLASLSTSAAPAPFASSSASASSSTSSTTSRQASMAAAQESESRRCSRPRSSSRFRRCRRPARRSASSAARRAVHSCGRRRRWPR